MRDTRAASRYANALLGVAAELNELDAVNADMLFLEEMISRVPEFSRFLKSPVISKEKKKKVFTALLTGKIGETTFRFIMLLSAKDREDLLPPIIARFRSLRDQRLGILDVGAKVAAKFTSEQEKQLGERLEGVTGKKIRLRFEEDRSLIGGFAIQYEDTVWDASVRRQMDLLRERLTGGA